MKENQVKPGWKTSEFWLTLIAVVLTALLPYFDNSSTVAQTVSVFLAILAALGYTAARTIVKTQ